MKKYPKYKKSTIDWLGEIPEHWKVRRIKYIFNEINERSENGDEELLSVSQFTGVTKKSDKVEKGGSLTNAKTLEGYKLVKNGDLVINIMLAWNGSLGISPYNGITSPAYSVYRSKIGGENYFGYLFTTPNAKQEFKKQSTGIIESRLRMYTDSFFDIKTAIPPKQEQTTIANFLDYKLEKIDRFISKKKQLITLLNEQKAAIINQAVTKGLNPNAKMKAIVNNWLNELPCAFEIESFSKNVFLKHGFQFREEHFSNEGIRIVKISQLSPKGILELSKASFVPLNYKDKFENIVIEKGDILMALTGGTIGKIIKANPKNEILLQNYRVGNFYPKNSKIIKNYLYWILKSDFVQAQMSFYVRETGQPNIGKGDFNKIQLIIPSIKEQAQIVNYIETETIKIEKTISTIEKEITLVEEYKTALIAEAVTGKIDVRDFEIPNQETPLAMVAEEVEIYKKS